VAYAELAGSVGAEREESDGWVIVVVACLHVERACTVWLRKLVVERLGGLIVRYCRYDVTQQLFKIHKDFQGAPYCLIKPEKDPLEFTESLIILSNHPSSFLDFSLTQSLIYPSS
jgi:hypothetical protein